MLHSVHPITLIKLAITVFHSTKPFSLIIPVSSFVSISVRPCILPLTMLLIVPPLALIYFSIITLHYSKSLQMIIDEMSIKYATLLHEHTFTMLFIVQELTIVFSIIMVNGLSFPVWQIVLPLTFISIPQNIQIPPIAISNIIPEVSLIVTPICFNKPALSFTSPISEFPFQIVSIIEFQRADSVGNISLQFPCVSGIQLFNIDCCFRNPAVKPGHDWQIREIGQS